MFCSYFTVDIFASDLAAATGNSGYSNNTLYFSASTCSGTTQVETFSTAGNNIPVSFCVDQDQPISLYYYVNNSLTYPTFSSYIDIGDCTGPCECHDGQINNNGSFSYYDCNGVLQSGSSQSGLTICYDIGKNYSLNITDIGLSETCSCTSPTPTPTNTVTTTPTPTPTPTSPSCSCYYYDVITYEQDVTRASGNTDSFRNGVVYVTYRNCDDSGFTDATFDNQDSPYQNAICVNGLQQYNPPSIFIWENNVQKTDILSFVQQGGCCSDSPTPSVTPTNTVTPSVTPTNTTTPSVTPTNTVTPSVTPTNNETPTPTPTNTVTPTQTLTPYLTPSARPCKSVSCWCRTPLSVNPTDIFSLDDNTNKIYKYNPITNRIAYLFNANTSGVLTDIAATTNKIFIGDENTNIQIYNYTSSPFSSTYVETKSFSGISSVGMCALDNNFLVVADVDVVRLDLSAMTSTTIFSLTSICPDCRTSGDIIYSATLDQYAITYYDNLNFFLYASILDSSGNVISTIDFTSEGITDMYGIYEYNDKLYGMAANMDIYELDFNGGVIVGPTTPSNRVGETSSGTSNATTNIFWSY